MTNVTVGLSKTDDEEYNLNITSHVRIAPEDLEAQRCQEDDCDGCKI